MIETNFTLSIKEFFKLSTGATAIVGKIEPNNYPTITPGDYVVKIINSKGVSHTFTNISEDIFARSNSSTENKYRSLQTLDNIDSFISDNEKTFIKGHKK